VAALMAELLERPGVAIEVQTPGGWRLVPHRV
jgi:hypothetical protein